MTLKLLRKSGLKCWYLRGTINGRRYDESTGTSDRKTADAYRVKREHEIHHKAIYDRPVNTTFAEATSHYLEQGGSPRFLQKLVQHFGDTRLTLIGQEQIDKAAATLLPRATPATRNRQVYSPTSSVLHHAAGLGWCAKPILRRPRASQGRVRWLTKGEADRLLVACSPHMRSLVTFLLYTGARASEALWLEWRHVDLDRRHVQFVDTKNGTSRGVPLHQRVVNELRGINDRDGSVFRTQTGEAYTKPKPGQDVDTSAGTRIKTGFKAACRRADIANFRVHDCRHTWATWHYRANRDLGALMRLGGWKTMSMVMRYAHVNVEELGHTIDAM